MTAPQRGSSAIEVQYLVLHDASTPYLLARVRWPDVFQAISPARPDWQSDPGLFDLPYDPSSTAVTPERAAAIAAEWGAQLSATDESETHAPSLIRRMPADWSNLSPAEKRAWAIEPKKTARRAANRAARRAARGRRWWRSPELVMVIDLTDADSDVLAIIENP